MASLLASDFMPTLELAIKHYINKSLDEMCNEHTQSNFLTIKHVTIVKTLLLYENLKIKSAVHSFR